MYETDFSTYNVHLARRLTRRLGRKWARQAGMPDPEYTPGQFREWLERRHNAGAARRGVFPCKGQGWVFVPAR